MPRIQNRNDPNDLGSLHRGPFVPGMAHHVSGRSVFVDSTEESAANDSLSLRKLELNSFEILLIFSPKSR